MAYGSHIVGIFYLNFGPHPYLKEVGLYFKEVDKLLKDRGRHTHDFLQGKNVLSIVKLNLLRNRVISPSFH